MRTTGLERKVVSSSRLKSTVMHGAIRKPSATTSQSNAIARKAAMHIVDLTGEAKHSYENIFSVIGLYDTVEDANGAARAYLEEEYGDEYEESVDKDDCVHIAAEGYKSETLRVDVKMKKLQKRKPAPPQPRTTPVSSQPGATTARGPAPIALTPTTETSPDYEEVYTVSCAYSHPVPFLTDISYQISLHSSRDEANEAAQRYLNDDNPRGWDKYSERFDPHDGGICITAVHRDAAYVVTVQKKNQECKPLIPQIPDLSPRSPSPELREIFLVTVEKRHHVCGSNEEGKLQSVEVRGAFKSPEDAKNLADEELGDLMDDGEWQGQDDEWELKEGEKDALLVLSAREWEKEEVVVVRVIARELG